MQFLAYTQSRDCSLRVLVVALRVHHLTVIILQIGNVILYGFMLKDGFYSVAPLDSPRVKK